jgi:ribosomal protein S18 acetylase RimI-like enzyme
MDITIRHAAEKDTERIADICREGWLETVADKLSETAQTKIVRFWYSYEKVLSDIKKGSYKYVAEMDDRVVGVIGGGMTNKRTGHIFVFYMDKMYRYQGIGSKLLEKITEDQKRKGAINQRVSVQNDNDLGLPFYYAHGFQMTEEVEADTGTHETQISLKMERMINEKS